MPEYFISRYLSAILTYSFLVDVCSISVVSSVSSEKSASSPSSFSSKAGLSSSKVSETSSADARSGLSSFSSSLAIRYPWTNFSAFRSNFAGTEILNPPSSAVFSFSTSSMPEYLRNSTISSAAASSLISQISTPYPLSRSTSSVPQSAQTVTPFRYSILHFGHHILVLLPFLHSIRNSHLYYSSLDRT